MKIDDLKLLCDKEVAKLLSMSPSWVRVERLKRRRGLPHFLAIDPIMIGTSPRYRIEDVWSLIKKTEVEHG